MTENEIRLINLIANHPDQVEAFEKAIKIIIEVLERPQSCEEQWPASAAEFF